MMFSLRAFVLATVVGTAAMAAPTKEPAANAARAARRMTVAEVESIVRGEIARGALKLPKGATLTQIRANALPEAPTFVSRVTIELTPPPRKAGPVSAVAVLTFWRDAAVTARVPISMDLSVPPEALTYDVVKGASITLVVQRGLVEVSVQAVAAHDADVGDVLQVLLRPSGRAIRARVAAKERAIAIKEGTR